MKNRSNLSQSSVPQAGCVSAGIPTSWSLLFYLQRREGVLEAPDTQSFLGSIKTH